MWDILASLLTGLFAPGPASTAKWARVRAGAALVLAVCLVIGGVVLVVLGVTVVDSSDRATIFMLAGGCLLMAGLLWYGARRTVLDQRYDR